MYGNAAMRNVGAFVKIAQGLISKRITAGGDGDNTAAYGPAVDRQGFFSAVLAVGVGASLSSGETVDTAIHIEDSANGTTGWADYLGHGHSAVPAAVELAYADEAAGQVQTYLVDLSGARRYIRAAVTPDLSKASTDTADIYALWVLGGPTYLPADT